MFGLCRPSHMYHYSVCVDYNVLSDANKIPGTQPYVMTRSNSNQYEVGDACRTDQGVTRSVPALPSGFPSDMDPAIVITI